MSDDSVKTATGDEGAGGDGGTGGAGSPPPDSTVPSQLGAQRYVLAAFFACGMAVTYVISKMLEGAWSRLTENAWVSNHAAFVSRLGEEERAEWSMLVGGILGIVAIVYLYRRDDVRTWTSEVASELAKVTWPSKKEVTNSTVVVILTSAFATVFLALLDRFWGFVTDLVYKG
jgi:preprotein translocase subunit SecE